MNPRAAIRNIDKQIDAIRTQLLAAETVDQLSAESWQAAWDKRPDLRQAETELFIRRGELQSLRDMASAKDAAKKAAAENRKEARIANKNFHVWEYLHDRSNGAQLLGLPVLAEWYGGGLATIKAAAL